MNYPLKSFIATALLVSIVCVTSYGQQLQSYNHSIAEAYTFSSNDINQQMYQLTAIEAQSISKFVEAYAKNRISKTFIQDLSADEKEMGKILSEQTMTDKSGIKLNLYVPEIAKKATLVLTDPQRKLSKEIEISNGASQLILENIDLSSDSILYSLIVNEILVDSKSICLK